MYKKEYSIIVVVKKLDRLVFKKVPASFKHLSLVDIFIDAFMLSQYFPNRYTSRPVGVLFCVRIFMMPDVRSAEVYSTFHASEYIYETKDPLHRLRTFQGTMRPHPMKGYIKTYPYDDTPCYSEKCSSR